LPDVAKKEERSYPPKCFGFDQTSERFVKRQYRLRKSEDFHRIIHASHFVKNQLFVVYFQPNNLNAVRVGISIPKKIGIAVTRNKIKRQIKAILRETLDVSTSIDYVIVPKHNYNVEEFNKSHDALKGLLEKIGDHNFEKIN
jgi:ribonuclease P protein component